MDPGTLKRLAELGLEQRFRPPSDTRFWVGLSVIIAVTLIGVGFLMYRIVSLNDAAKVRFMQQCMEDHKEYECTYLWRSSDRPGPDVIPIAIPIPTK